MEPSTPELERKGRRSRERGLVDTGDLAISGVLWAGCGYLYYLTTLFDQPGVLLGDNVGPADFPRLVIFFIALLALILPFEGHLQPDRWQKIVDGRRRPVKPIAWATIGFLLVASLAGPYLGTILTMFLVSIFLPLLWGERRLWLVCSFAILFTLAVTWVFNVMLQVFFEPGMFKITAKLFPFF